MDHRSLAAQLLEMQRHDLEVRERLAASGELFAGYAAEMEAVHRENAAQLAAVVETFGWPGLRLVGPEAAEAAWLVAQHAISCPELQRRFHSTLREAVENGDAAPSHLAYLTDRIRCNELRPQVYGTIHDWDEHGRLSPCPIEEPDSVEMLRAAVGLPPLSRTTARLRREAERANQHPPESFQERRARQLQWAREVGWVRQDT